MCTYVHPCYPTRNVVPLVSASITPLVLRQDRQVRLLKHEWLGSVVVEDDDDRDGAGLVDRA